MRDADVRSALYEHLLGVHASELANTRFVDELGICGEVRVDVAVMNGLLAGYELKSERDTLKRLPLQVEMYSRVFDRSTLVVADKHLQQAREMIRPWWGVITASQHQDGAVTLVTERQPSQNPDLDPEALAWLLWRPELLEELESRNLADGVRSKPRRCMVERLASQLELDELRSVVRERLKRRQRWRSDR